MNMNFILFLILCISLICILLLSVKLWQVHEHLSVIKEALEDIKLGNLNRRVLARDNDMTKQICYDINSIALHNQMQLIQQQQSEAAYKRLMTSLSHDVKTPLTSLMGYLEAIQTGVVLGKERDDYLRIAYEKARHLSAFVQSLFEWVKLDSGEQIFHFEEQDICELTRDILADWIPALENAGITYEVCIPEEEYRLRIDAAAYTRIVNNLLQNVLVHSEATSVAIALSTDETGACLTVCDNGKGIPPMEQTRIFERMYQCDASRSAKGNGLGLSIVRELVLAHRGTVFRRRFPRRRRNVSCLFLQSPVLAQGSFLKQGTSKKPARLRQGSRGILIITGAKGTP